MNACLCGLKRFAMSSFFELFPDLNLTVRTYVVVREAYIGYIPYMYGSLIWFLSVQIKKQPSPESR